MTEFLRLEGIAIESPVQAGRVKPFALESGSALPSKKEKEGASQGLNAKLCLMPHIL